MRLAAAIIACLALAGCGSTQSVMVKATALCDGTAAPWRQINIRRADVISDETAREIEAANLAREGVGCKYERPQKAPPVTS